MPAQFVIWLLSFQQSNSLWFDSSTFLRFKAIKSIFQTMHFHWYQKKQAMTVEFFSGNCNLFFPKKAKCTTTLASRSLHSRLFVKLNSKKKLSKLVRNGLWWIFMLIKIRSISTIYAYPWCNAPLTSDIVKDWGWVIKIK